MTASPFCRSPSVAAGRRPSIWLRSPPRECAALAGAPPSAAVGGAGAAAAVGGGPGRRSPALQPHRQTLRQLRRQFFHLRVGGDGDRYRGFRRKILNRQSAMRGIDCGDQPGDVAEGSSDYFFGGKPASIFVLIALGAKLIA